MTDTFSVRAARPKSTGKEVMSDSQPPSNPGGQHNATQQEGGDAEPAPRRKRRTRAEIEAAQPAKEEAPDMMVLKACLIHLRTLKPAAAARVIDTLAVVFK
jgi:hypothetical protein